MKKIIFAFLFSPLLCLLTNNLHAQSDTSKGIKFEEGLSWEQVKKKAKKENKYLFVDAYTTWCGPCKLMEKEVFPKEKVGQFMNEKFVSVRVQMDTGKLDNENVKKWYVDAQKIGQEFNASVYPLYLFFSPNGEVVHRASGALRDTDFIKVASGVFDVNKQYYTLLNEYNGGQKNIATMRYLALVAKGTGEKDKADNIARDVIKQMNSIPTVELITRKNIEFVVFSFFHIWTSKDNVFKLFYSNAKKVDELMALNGFSQGIVDRVIRKEEINPKVWPNNISLKREPDWNKIALAISKKYSKAYAERNILNAKLRWHQEKNNWDELIKLNIVKIDKYGLDTTKDGRFAANNMIYNLIFYHCDDPVILNRAIKWMEIIMTAEHYESGETLDTYANLLYKIGRTEEAIIWEEKAFTMDPKNTEIKEAYEKMKKGEKTW